MKYSFRKLFPMGTDQVDKFIETILSYGGGYTRVDPPPVFPGILEGKSLYSGPQGFLTIEKKAEKGKWKVTIET